LLQFLLVSFKWQQGQFQQQEQGQELAQEPKELFCLQELFGFNTIQ